MYPLQRKHEFVPNTTTTTTMANLSWRTTRKSKWPHSTCEGNSHLLLVLHHRTTHTFAQATRDRAAGIYLHSSSLTCSSSGWGSWHLDEVFLAGLKKKNRWMWYIYMRQPGGKKKQQMVAETFWSQPPVNQDDASTTGASCTRKRNAFNFLVFPLSRFTRGSCSCAVRGNQPKSRGSTTYSSQIIMLKILTTNAGKPKLHSLL